MVSANKHHVSSTPRGYLGCHQIPYVRGLLPHWATIQDAATRLSKHNTPAPMLTSSSWFVSTLDSSSKLLESPVTKNHWHWCTCMFKHVHMTEFRTNFLWTSVIHHHFLYQTRHGLWFQGFFDYLQGSKKKHVGGGLEKIKPYLKVSILKYVFTVFFVGQTCTSEWMCLLFGHLQTTKHRRPGGIIKPWDAAIPFYIILWHFFLGKWNNWIWWFDMICLLPIFLLVQFDTSYICIQKFQTALLPHASSRHMTNFFCSPEYDLYMFSFFWNK